MGTHLFHLPAELHFMIFEELQSNTDLYQKDLRNLSKTCKFYQRTLLPYTFSTIVLHNEDASASSVNAATREPGEHANCVNELYFRKVSLNNRKRGDRSRVYHLPDSVAEILSNLTRRYRKLERVVIDWQLDCPTSPPDELLNFFNPTRQEFERLLNQDVCYCCHFIKRVFDAISNNANSGMAIKSLGIKDLPVSPTTSFVAAGLKNILRGLDSFKLNFMFEVGNPRAIDAYGPFCSSFRKAYFAHMVKVTEFSVTSPPYGPFGLINGSNNAKFTLKSKDLPLLKRLTLKDCFICRELSDFLRAHADTLESAVLDDCFASRPTICPRITAYNPMDWSTLFEDLAYADPKRLVEFEVLPLDRTLGEDNSGDDDKDAEYRALKQSYPGRRFFKYGYLLRPIAPAVLEQPDVMNQRFIGGEDQMAYDLLMDIIARNRRQIPVASLQPALPATDITTEN